MWRMLTRMLTLQQQPGLIAQELGHGFSNKPE
jgi:hypothetical protein